MLAEANPVSPCLLFVELEVITHRGYRCADANSDQAVSADCVAGGVRTTTAEMVLQSEKEG